MAANPSYTPQAKYVQGPVLNVAYTPAAAVATATANVVVANGLVFVADNDIAAGVQGALSAPVGNVYSFLKDTSTFVGAFTAALVVAASQATPVYWNASTGLATSVATGNTYIGYALVSAATGVGSVLVVRVNPFNAGGLGVNDAITVLSGSSDAIPPHVKATYIVTTAGVDAMTLAAPTATVDDGLIIEIVSGSADAHTITATGLLNTGAATVNVATFAAHAGASLRLIAYNGKWYVLAQIAITFT